jgi:predicted transcriptional regulator
VITAHVPEPLAERVDRLAERLDRPRGWIVKQALSAWVAEEEERDRLTREAMAEVDAGNVVDDAVIAAWIDSLDPGDVPRG